ncbi:unnamed protein product [Peniophora sp. CBMAI 1063]|nr:unnamed protein product [Peniophora sp. CBMAI 1063]
MASRAYSPLSQEEHEVPERPTVYYGDGPFDPPDSDDEADGLIEKPRSPRIAEAARESLENGDLGLYVGGQEQARWASVRKLIITLAALVAVAATIGLFAALSYHGPVRTPHGSAHITMDHVFNGTFSAERQGLAWVPEAGDGVYSTYAEGFILLVDLNTNTTRILLNTADVTNEAGEPFEWSDWKLSADMRYILVKTNYLKQWRHSSFGNYYIHNLGTGQTVPLTAPTNPPTVAYATWSPTGESIAYVQSNDLYVVRSPADIAAPIRVTSTGNATLFHGVPDWVYEEEVFSADYALWWSPDSAKLTFLTFDETEVPEYVFPVYNPSSWNNSAIEPYTSEVRMRYPKPGYPNPTVSARVFDLDRYITAGHILADETTAELTWNGRLSVADSIIAEVAWLDNVVMLLKEVNRNADVGSVVYFDLSTPSGAHGSAVRKLGKDGEQGDEGWIDANQDIYPLPSAARPNGLPAYLDIVPNEDGFNHVALFSPANNGTPQWLTSGPWEVAGGIQAVDAQQGLIYLLGAAPTSIERHLYSVPLPGLAAAKAEGLEDDELAPLKPLTDIAAPGYHSVSFSPEAGFYLLSYDGPNIPWQRVVKAGNESSSFLLTDNQELNTTWSQFEMPIVTHSTIESEGYELNVQEIRPPHMDDSGRTKYPVLFRVYGGPFSQMVTQRFGVDWHYFLACSQQYIVVTVDGRGTGWKGRGLRNMVKGNLGFWETRDQIEAARQWASKPYVDPKRIGIWGWSYGGFMSLKVVEAAAGIHSLAMAVAPPTSWRMYDTIYTERYMNTPQLNPNGYINASIVNVTNFDNVDFALAHGSADDNVHYANTAHLLDMFTAANIRKYRFRMFTDSDHSISKRGAYRELHEWLTAFMLEKWGKGGKRRGW